MNKLFKNSMVLYALAGILFLGSCKKDEVSLPANALSFESDALGSGASETQLTINVNLGRSLPTASAILINMELTSLTYTTDFTTVPAAANNQIALTIPANTSTGSFLLRKTAGAVYEGDEKIKFTIQAFANGMTAGEKSVLNLSFSEIIATGGTIEVAGGGALYPNKVFVDLSGNRQTSVARTNWDLAFSSSDNYRVLLNSPNGMLAYALTKTDMASVTAADTAAVQLGSKLSVGAIFTALTTSSPAWLSTTTAWMDNPTGDLTKTAIAAVSADASANVVYIINRGDGPGNPATKLGWKKIRIIRNGSNYTIQHANINETNFTSTTITKDPTYNYNYFSFTTGAVTVEPAAKKWDIAWNGFTNTTPSGNGYDVPYYFQDIVIQNLQVQTVQVLTATTPFDSFTEANLTGLTFSSSQINIGSGWRSGGGPGVSPSIRTDRYYIVKDPDGNYYKVRFTALTTAGERGRPVLQYVLVKKA